MTMAMNGAQALVAKKATDLEFAKEVETATNAGDFQEVISKYGYDCSWEDFKFASRTANSKTTKQESNQLDQLSGGLSMVGIDYGFVALNTSSS